MNRRFAMDQKEAQKRSREIIDSAEAFVLSTVNGNSPQSRVMGPKLIEEGMTIYMETYNDSRKVTQLKKNPRAQLLFISEDKSEVVTLSGKAAIEVTL
jgi:general stress protein 26